jgi:hypothetical protein
MLDNTPDRQGGRRWRQTRSGRLVRHAGPEHVLVFAPTRSGKGIGTIVPTLLSWPASVVVCDIKKELWQLTAGMAPHLQPLPALRADGSGRRHVRMAYAANREETAKTISELMGQSTASKRQRSRSGKGFLGAQSVSESEQEFARPLMTPDEVLRRATSCTTSTTVSPPARAYRRQSPARSSAESCLPGPARNGRRPWRNRRGRHLIRNSARIEIGRAQR